MKKKAKAIAIPAVTPAHGMFALSFATGVAAILMFLKAIFMAPV